MDEELAAVPNQIQEVNSNPTVVLNGSIFNLCTLSGDGDKQVLSADKFDASTASNLTSENVFSVEDSKGKIFSLPDNSFTNVQVSEFGLGPVNNGVDIATSTVPTQLLQHDPISGIGSGDGNNTSFIQIITSIASTDADSSTLPFPTAAATSTSALSTAAAPGQTIVTVCSNGNIMEVIPVTSQAVSTHNTQPQPKKRGGWPKGKRRKEVKSNSIPKAPQTGYVFYVNENRARVRESNPELSFPAVSKILGGEWSALDTTEKQKFLDLAEEDKARYKEELRIYQQSDEYLSFLAKKKAKNGMSATSSVDGDDYSVDDIDSDVLYCKVCDQYFSSMHNRKEHMFGKMHLTNVSNAIEMSKEEELAADAEDPSQLSLSSFAAAAAAATEDTEKVSEPLDLERFLLQFMEKNYEREMELIHLRKEMQTHEARNLSLVSTIKEYQELHEKYSQDLDNAKAEGSALAMQINTLRMVPTLFGVINF